ncbi:MAG: sensor histidine kinase, partial [Candidatus Saccharimonadales bacterium]
FRSATFKLTMWYLALVMAISLIFSVVLYNVATHELDRGLHNETVRIYRQFPVFEGNPLLKPGVDYDNGAHRILLQLAVFNVVVLVGAGLSSYWLARRTLEPIEAAHEQQKRFTADVSHELRTPLTALRMESEVALMNKKVPAKELRRTITSNLEEVTKLERLVNNLLRLSHLETDELRQQFTPLSGQTVVETALKQIDPLAKDRKVKLEKDLHDLPVYGDPDALTQLLVILLDNAVKYSPARASVSVSLRQKDDDAVITVEDHGPGIDPVSLEHVFDRFYRADESRTRAGDEKSEGYGLGLSIAKLISDLHGGTIAMSSRVGHGTTVTVTLPAGPAPRTLDLTQPGVNRRHSEEGRQEYQRV